MIKYGGVGMHNVRGGSPGVCATPLIEERIDRVSQEPLIEIFTCPGRWLSPQRGLRALNLLASCMHGARHSVNAAPLSRASRCQIAVRQEQFAMRRCHHVHPALLPAPDRRDARS